MDTQLVIRAQRGDEAAFAAITASSYVRLQDVAYRILRDPARFEAWSYRTLVRQCYREARKNRRAYDLAQTAEPVARDDLSVVRDRDQLEQGFQQLSMDHRTVVVLHHYLGLTLDEIADALDIPVGTVNSRLSRAMANLRQALQVDDATLHPAPQEVAR